MPAHFQDARTLKVKEAATYNTIVWPLAPHAHSDTRPMSFAYLPVASAWVVTFQNLLCTQTHPLPCHPPSHWLRLFSSQTFSHINTPTFLKPSHFFIPTCQWRWNRKCCEMSAYKIQSWRITQKQANNIQNAAKVWNQENEVGPCGW